MSRRLQPRRRGRWVRATPENTLGLTFNIHGYRMDGSTWCGAMNPSAVGEPRPTVCSLCGELLAEAGDERHQNGLVIVRGRRLFLRVVGLPLCARCRQPEGECLCQPGSTQPEAE